MRCHSCNNVQRDRRAYRDHLLPVHGEVARRGSDVPVHLEGRELEAVWASAHRSRMSGPVRAARHREALGLPRVSDQEAERRIKDNRARTARCHRAAARAQLGAAATLGAPEGTPTTEGQDIRDRDQGQRHEARAASSRSSPKIEQTITVQVGGTRRVYSPCDRCAHCRCRQPKDYSAAQDSPSPPRRRSPSSLRPSSSSRRHPRPPTRTSSPRRTIRHRGRTRPSHITSSWAVRHPKGTSSGARISTWALRGPG